MFDTLLHRKNYDKEIQHFCEVMKEHLSAEDYSTIKRNISNINISYKKANDKFNPTLGTCDRLGNIMLYDKEHNSVLYHELLHLSSTMYDEKNECGFLHYVQSGSCFGYGLNEGYTDLLTKRYFANGEEINGYKNEVYYASLIEKLIGEDKMKHFYFNCDVPGLIDELCKYNTIDSVMGFFNNLDLFIIMDGIVNDKYKKAVTDRQYGLSLENIKESEEINEKIRSIHKELSTFLVDSFGSTYAEKAVSDDVKKDVLASMKQFLNDQGVDYNVDTEVQKKPIK